MNDHSAHNASSTQTSSSTADNLSDAPPYESNTTLAELAQWLGTMGSVVLLTHTKPDGDAAGSTLGLARALIARGIDATCWYAGPLPLWFEHLAEQTPWKLIERDGTPPPSDAIVICDTGSWTQLEPVRAWLADKANQTAIIDHHLKGDPHIAARLWIEPTAAAVCQPVALLCAAILNCNGSAKLPVDVATPLYLGIGTDTGWFRHSNVNAGVLEDAAQLLSAGVDHSALYTLSEQRDRPSRLRLVARALSSAQFVADDRAVIMSLTMGDMSQSGAGASETGGIVDQAMSIDTIRVGALLTEVHDENHAQGPMTKLSLRSKELGALSVDVNMLAQRFGGGGHARAAGARHAGNLQQTTEELTKVFIELLS